MISGLIGLFIVTVLFVLYKSGMNSLTFRIPLIIGYFLYIFISNLVNPDLIQLILSYLPCRLSGNLQYHLVKHTDYGHHGYRSVCFILLIQSNL